MAAILLLSLDRMLAERIGQAMTGRASVDLAQTVDGQTPALIIIDAQAIPPERSLSAAIAAVRHEAAGRPVVIATDERDADQLLAAIRAGADDIIPREESADVTPVLTRLLSSAKSDREGQGGLTLILGADRDACAMVATDLAICRGQSLLIDCTLPTSAAQSYLDLRVDYGLASALADRDRLDASLLASSVARHGPSGLMLLTFDGGTGAEPAGITPADFNALIRLLRSLTGEVVLNAGSLRHGGLLRDVVAQADRVELLCSQSIREVEACRRLLDSIGAGTAQLEAMRLLVWDHQPGILLDPRRMADVLGTGRVLPLPTDRVRLRNALNAGRPLAVEADGGAYMQALRKACGVAPARRGIDRLRAKMIRLVERAS
ncbi:AAA family ATPase [Sphingobium bisphenolivorans]|uniref:AAA family ATPase n=1 Tax=Sphingobium bisphenolivorans TaxID=1335760 RepID=UPI00039F8890|nr:MinD/ParA family protein [Sphingobium bisphenolivorans]